MHWSMYFNREYLVNVLIHYNTITDNKCVPSTNTSIMIERSEIKRDTTAIRQWRLTEHQKPLNRTCHGIKDYLDDICMYTHGTICNSQP